MDFLKKCIAVLVLFSIFSFFITIFEKNSINKVQFDRSEKNNI